MDSQIIPSQFCLCVAHTRTSSHFIFPSFVSFLSIFICIYRSKYWIHTWNTIIHRFTVVRNYFLKMVPDFFDGWVPPSFSFLLFLFLIVLFLFYRFLKFFFRKSIGSSLLYFCFCVVPSKIFKVRTVIEG